MPEIKGTKTEQNLRDAFAGESQAPNKYTSFAPVAKREGYEKIVAFFLETAENEKDHAKLHFKHLGGIGTTADNLRAAAGGESEECTDMHPRMAREAKEEGFPEIAYMVEAIGKIEAAHTQRYLKLLVELESGKFFARDEPARWRCRNCGLIHEGTEALKVCPVYKHPQAYFELVEERYLAGTMQLAFKSPVQTKALQGGAAFPQAAAGRSVVRQPPGGTGGSNPTALFRLRSSSTHPRKQPDAARIRTASADTDRSENGPT
jgi:rubrerythrin